jgi:uncharacterized protein (DUF1015 family)
MEVKPFKAFRYDEAVVGDVGDCVAPPYDVISNGQQQRLYEKSPYNIVRITRGKTTPDDNQTHNQYTRAAGYFNTWLKKGVLKQDSTEAIYAYVQDFKLADNQLQRISFIASAKLEEFGKAVRPHEQTLEFPIIDRLNLQRATAAGFGLPFMLYEDREQTADKIIEKTTGQKPLIDFVDDEDVRHRLFAITGKADIDAITEMMSNKCCIIADGHHRYITGLTYSKESPSPAARYQMIAFANTCHEGLVVLATHRLVGNLDGFNSEKLIAGLKRNFEIVKYRFDSPQTKTDAKQKMLEQMKNEHDSEKNVFGIYTAGRVFYVAVLKNKQAMDAAVPQKSNAWRSLDVSILHKLVLEELLGINEEKLAAGTNIEYIKGASNAVDESIAAVDGRQRQAAFFMNPIRIEQLKMVTDATERMPQKSTYFYPKIYTGLTIDKL